MRRPARTTSVLLFLTACSQRAPLAAESGGTTEPPPPLSSSPAPVVAVSEAPTAAPTTPSPAHRLEDDALLVLPIPPRKHAPESPPPGWCGETALQEALLHLGVWAPQRVINRAGRPVHPDLYSTDIPVALGGLGVRYTFYSARKGGFVAYATWIKEALAAGDPIFAGVKLLPTKHPEWGLDHFVLVVGHGKQGLLVNTTWGHRAWADDQTTEGISFKNVAYGIRLRGIALPPDARPARISVLDENTSTVRLRVGCEGLTEGALYRIERRRSRSDKQPLWSETAVAVDGRVEQELTVEATASSRFHCVRN
jgi:hypothetical protein